MDDRGITKLADEAFQIYKRIKAGRIKLNEIKDKIDVLLMSHSLEHFPINDTHILFQDIHNVLADDGIVIIEVPHADLRISNFHKERLNDTPHLSFFSLESLSKLIDKSKFDLNDFEHVISMHQKHTDSKCLKRF